MAPESDFRDDDAAAVALQLAEQGVIVNTGAHGQREGLATHWELWSFVRGGFTPLEALKLATINPARYLGMDQDIGSLEPGKLADIVVLNRNPLIDIHHTQEIADVMINGRLFDAKTLAERVTGDRQAPRLWWHDRDYLQIR
jgi:imidazolonepropionase-like amidohydrolase